MESQVTAMRGVKGMYDLIGEEEQQQRAEEEIVIVLILGSLSLYI